MSGYTTLLERVGAETYELREQLVESFIINKCIKKIDRFNHTTKIELLPKYEAYIYYTIPPNPTFTLTIEKAIIGYNLSLTPISAIYLDIEEVGVYYNKTGTFSTSDQKLVFDNKWSASTVALTTFDVNTTYYFKPYIITCIGTVYGNVVSELLYDYLLDTYGEIISDTYGEYILVV